MTVLMQGPGVGLLDQDLGSDLDDAVGRYAKVLGGIRRGAREPNKELLLPSWHIRLRRGSERTSGQEEGRRRDIDVEPLAATLLQNFRYAWRFHEAVVTVMRVNVSPTLRIWIRS